MDAGLQPEKRRICVRVSPGRELCCRHGQGFRCSPRAPFPCTLHTVGLFGVRRRHLTPLERTDNVLLSRMAPPWRSPHSHIRRLALPPPRAVPGPRPNAVYPRDKFADKPRGSWSGAPSTSPVTLFKRKVPSRPGPTTTVLRNESGANESGPHMTCFPMKHPMPQSRAPCRRPAEFAHRAWRAMVSKFCPDPSGLTECIRWSCKEGPDDEDIWLGSVGVLSVDGGTRARLQARQAR